MAKKQSNKAAKKPAEEPKKPLPTGKELHALEMEFRRYTKWTGGFRKGLSEKGKKRALELQAIMGKKKLEWDASIEILYG
jgi:hypothetical protein